MMRTLLLCLAVGAVLCEDIPSPATLLADPAKYNSFLECVGGKQDSCEPWAKDVIAYIPEALNAGCAGCPALQKDLIRKVTIHMKNNDPEKYQALVKQIDRDQSTDKDLFRKFLESTD